MWRAVGTLGEQFGQGWSAGSSVEFNDEIREIVVCGMGGSSFPADYLNLALPLNRQLTVCRDYDFDLGRIDASPGQILVVAASFSGNTEETIAAYRRARDAGAQVAVLTTGGALSAEAAEDGNPRCLITKPWPDFQPRAAVGLFIGALARIIDAAGYVGQLEPLMAKLDRFCGQELDVNARAMALAEALVDRVPVIYSTYPLAHTAARVCKIKLNENAKMPAFFNEFPELNHNEMEGFRGLTANYTAVVLRDPALSTAMARRVEATSTTLAEVGIPSFVLDVLGETALERALYAARVFDYASCLIAYGKGLDPNPVPLVEAFKKRLVQPD